MSSDDVISCLSGDQLAMSREQRASQAGQADGDHEAQAGAVASPDSSEVRNSDDVAGQQLPPRVKRVTWGEAETRTLAEEERSSSSESDDDEVGCGQSWEEGSKAPWFVAPVLVCAVVAISSGGAVCVRHHSIILLLPRIGHLWTRIVWH